MADVNKLGGSAVEKAPGSKTPDHGFDMAKAEKEPVVDNVEIIKTAEVGELETPAIEPGAVGIGPAPAAPVDETLEKIEDILEEDLEEVYFNLPVEKKEEFKKEGEEAAVEILGLISRAKIKARKIFSLIRKWLRVIPGLNKFFLDQEAKIKTDEILDLAEDEQNKNLK